MTEEDKAPIGIILLAAGSSSRMGESKQLLIIDGQPLLRRTIKVALDANPDNLIVVLGSNFEEHQKVISDLPVEIVYNENWEKGMGNSLKRGLTRLLELNPKTRAVVVLVCDQPLLTTEHIINIIRASKILAAPIIATAYGGTIGVPALFEKSLFEALLNLPDNHGAKSVIQNFALESKSIPFPDGAVDLDTPEDYSIFKTNN